jgi:ribosomal protein S18 acetylase RimI-like enzyme
MLGATIDKSQGSGGLRLLDPNRDLSHIADLIEESFAGEFGQTGLAAVRDLRLMAGLSPLLWILTRASGEFRDAFTGFVWVDEGRVVGNISLSRARSDSNRWHIANVAVSAGYRNQGIGRQLVEAGLQFIKAREGEWAILQVRHDNIPALRIYDSMGFERLFATTELYREGPFEGRPPSNTPAGYQIRPCRPEDMRQMHDLAVAATPAMERWLRGFKLAEFRRSAIGRLRERIGGALSGTQVVRLCADCGDDTLVGHIQVKSEGWGGAARVQLHVHPEHRGEIEPALTSQALSTLKVRAGHSAAAEHPAEHSEGVLALKDLGFMERRTLITMRRQL